MASLYIKDPETAEAVARVARRLGTSKTEAVRRSIEELEAKLGAESGLRLLGRLDAWRREHPLSPPTGLKADKAFFDALWGEEH